MGNFSSVFKSLRLSYKLTQDELAKALGISKSAISMYENGNREPDFVTLEKIADFYNVDMDYLLGRSTNTTELPQPQRNPSPYDDVELLIARNGKKMSKEQKLKLIQLLLEDDK